MTGITIHTCVGPKRLFTVMSVATLLCLTCSSHGLEAGTFEPPTFDGHDPDTPVTNDFFADTVTRGEISSRFEIYNPHSDAQLKAVRDMGFTQVILDRPKLAAAATELDLDVVIANWWTLETELTEIEKAIEFAKEVDPHHLVAISMMDEPERYAPNTPFFFYKSLYTSLRAVLDKDMPGAKLEISHWGPLAHWTPKYYQAFVPLYQSTDRIRLMPYPDLFEGPLSDVYYQMIRSRHVMQLADRNLPQIVILQTWVLPDKPILPTIPELRVMAYQAILAGAHTISFFNYDPDVWSKTDGFTEGFADLMTELTGFSRQYQDAIVESHMTPTGILHATIQQTDGQTVSISVNTNRSATDDLAALAVSIETPPATTPFTHCVPPKRSFCRPLRIRRPIHILRHVRHWRR